MIGKIYTFVTPYFDSQQKKQSFKSRPVLISGCADTEDFNVLPVFKVTNKNNLDPIYDLCVDPSVYPKLNCACISYVRVHKQTTVHIASIGKIMSDMKCLYVD